MRRRPHQQVSGFDGRSLATQCMLIPDPPGDADALRFVARELRATATDFRAAVMAAHAAAVEPSQWCGTSADAYHEKITFPKNLDLNQVADRYWGFAAAVDAFAATLEEKQAAARHAHAAVAEALEARLAAEQSDGPWDGPHLFGIGSDPATRARVQVADQTCRSAAHNFIVTYNAWVDSVNQCISALDQVNHRDDLRNPHGLHRLLNELSDLLDAVSTITGMLGLIVLAVNPATAGILLAVAACASAAKLYADGTRKLGFGEDVSLGDVAFDALGALPASGSVKAVRAGRAAATAGAGLRGARAEFSREMNTAIEETYRGAAVTVDADLGWDVLAGPGVSGARESWNRRREGPVRVYLAQFEPYLKAGRTVGDWNPQVAAVRWAVGR